MASNAFECEVCNEDYNSGERKPLSLPCGHTFCHRCLSRVLATAIARCPKCRKSAVGVQLNNLPIIYALIPTTKKNIQETHPLPSADQCKSHGYNLDYFCTVCGGIICRKCSKQFHAQHRVEFIDDIVDRDELAIKFVSELQGEMMASVDRVSKFLSLTKDISESLNATRVWEEGLPQYQNLFQSRITATTQDLKTWQNAAPKSTEEKRELFKKLCQYWREKEKVFLDKQELSNFNQNLDELTAAAQTVQKITSDLKLRLQGKDGRQQQGIAFSSYSSPSYPPNLISYQHFPGIRLPHSSSFQSARQRCEGSATAAAARH